ncbi:MAG: DUF1772 domain-containing protein, partial [Cytophagaceae bacterium]
MKRFLNSITPAFIHRVNDGMLRNNVLGWQLQLPQILWLWLLILVFTLPVPLLYPLKFSGSDDEFAVGSIGVLIGIMQFFLYGFLLIRFNATKSFGKPVLFHGTMEQLAYVVVMFLCLTQVVLFPLVIDFRKSGVISSEEIKEETVIYNKGRHYIMDDFSYYRYFPDDATFKKFMEINAVYQENYRNQEEYYSQVVQPMLDEFMSRQKSSEYPARNAVGPKLYFTGIDYLTEDEDYYSSETNYLRYIKYQLVPKTDAERLMEIKNFIRVFKKYENYGNDGRDYDYTNPVTFQDPETILKQYKLNQFTPVVEPAGASVINNYSISRVHDTLLSSTSRKIKGLATRSLICFHVALVFAIFLFIFKNVRLREFILSYVYVGLLTIVVVIFTIIGNLKEGLALHVPIFVFFTGLVVGVLVRDWNHYSHIRTVFIIVSNMCFAYAPIYFFLYATEYLRWGKEEGWRG